MDKNTKENHPGCPSRAMKVSDLLGFGGCVCPDHIRATGFKLSVVIINCAKQQKGEKLS